MFLHILLCSLFSKDDYLILVRWRALCLIPTRGSGLYGSIGILAVDSWRSLIYLLSLMSEIVR